MDSESVQDCYDKLVTQIDSILKDGIRPPVALSTEAIMALDDASLRLKLWEEDVTGESNTLQAVDKDDKDLAETLHAVFRRISECIESLRLVVFPNSKFLGMSIVR
jgi:hypothetical protein